MANEVMTLEQRVKQRIDETIGSLIPEEDMTRMIESLTARMMRDKLPSMIEEEIRDKLRENIKAELNKPEWTHTWVHAGPEGMMQPAASALVSEIMKQNAQELFAGMISGIAANVVMNMRNNRII